MISLTRPLAALKSWFGLKPFLQGLMGGPLLGVDIGTTSVKMAEVRAEGGKPRLVNYGVLDTYEYLERANSVLQTSNLKLMEQETVEYLKILLAQVRPSTDRVFASLPSFSAFTTLIEMPRLSESEVRNVITLQAKQYIPLPIEAVTVDWLKVGEREDAQGVKKYQVLLVAVVKEQVQRYRRIFKAAGLNPVGLEIEGVSLARVLSAGIREPTLIVDIGTRSTAFVVAAEGAFKFGGQTDFAGGSLTHAIASGLNISTHRAETLKRMRGLGKGGGEQELSTLMEPIVDVIISEARRVKENYENTYHETVGSVVLCGGGANLLGLEAYVVGQFKLQVRVANPFERIAYPPTLAPAVKELGPLVAVSVGLSIKDIRV